MSKNSANETDVLALAAAQIATEKDRADRADSALAAEKTRADAAEGTVDMLKAQLTEASSHRVDQAEMERRDATICGLQKLAAAEKARADLAESPTRLRAAVKARVSIETAAAAVLGNMRLDGFDDRQLMDVVIEKLLGKQVNEHRSDDYVRACFDTAVDGYFGSKDALAHLRASVKATEVTHIDSRGAREQMIARNVNASKPRDPSATESK